MQNRSRVEVVPPFPAFEKTPPQAASAATGNPPIASMPVALNHTDCTCEHNLAQLIYWASVALAENPGLDPSEVYRLWSTDYSRITPTGRPDLNLRLPICCRVRILSPLKPVIISADGGASSILGNVTDAPAPSTLFEIDKAELPPIV